ncbi:hypothetical protein AcW1_000806 [Taiwanofungus camphoratus]|nr:hypothetical protein AcV7_000826 [Antrodia cinnamomea]KAI0963841.1 hypothetical protein AcW1_000806 [Antrodia cinnamomea]
MSAAAAAPPMSTSTTLWATASKEWVIPAKPKPGRKPKKDIAPPVQEPTEVDNKGRRVQNRAAQRAFRERKQSQLAELQARVQQYEQGEVERNVALQNIAKRLKEENEKLRSENTLLKEKVAQLTESIAQDGTKKRTRAESLPRSPSISSSQQARKKSKVHPDPSNSSYSNAPYVSSPSSYASSPSHTSFSPVPMLPSPQDAPMDNTLNMYDVSSHAKNGLFESGRPMGSLCGFCNETTPCVCGEMAMQQVSEQLSLTDPSPQKMEHAERQADIEMQHANFTRAPTQSSILDNLPAYQPPVPLRRRSPNPSSQPIFPVSLPSEARTNVASCSGDPSNCLACADDAFGKAFCAAISETVASTSSCGYCPNGSGDVPPVTGCCGNPAACGGCGEPPANASAMGNSSMMHDSQSSTETIPCDDAWRQLKSHPNVTFSDLTLLAEVVARRSKCTGPSVEILPAPGSITPERGISPHLPQHHSDTNNQSVLLGDPHAHYNERQRAGMVAPSPPPQLVPQEVLIRCGRQRVREVMADGVREALRILDAKFPLP